MPDRLSKLSNKKLVRSEHLGLNDDSINGCNEAHWVSEELLNHQMSNDQPSSPVSHKSVFGDYRFPRFDISEGLNGDHLSND